MDERIIRDAEWAHLMHPVDANALEKLRTDETLWTVRAFCFCGVMMAGVTAFSVWLLL